MRFICGAYFVLCQVGFEHLIDVGAYTPWDYYLFYHLMNVNLRQWRGSKLEMCVYVSGKDIYIHYILPYIRYFWTNLPKRKFFWNCSTIDHENCRQSSPVIKELCASGSCMAFTTLNHKLMVRLVEEIQIILKW